MAPTGGSAKPPRWRSASFTWRSFNRSCASYGSSWSRQPPQWSTWTQRAATRAGEGLSTAVSRASAKRLLVFVTRALTRSPGSPRSTKTTRPSTRASAFPPRATSSTSRVNTSLTFIVPMAVPEDFVRFILGGTEPFAASACLSGAKSKRSPSKNHASPGVSWAATRPDPAPSPGTTQEDSHAIEDGAMAALGLAARARHLTRARGRPRLSRGDDAVHGRGPAPRTGPLARRPARELGERRKPGGSCGASEGRRHPHLQQPLRDRARGAAPGRARHRAGPHRVAGYLARRLAPHPPGRGGRSTRLAGIPRLAPFLRRGERRRRGPIRDAGPA